MVASATVGDQQPVENAAEQRFLDALVELGNRDADPGKASERHKEAEDALAQLEQSSPARKQSKDS